MKLHAIRVILNEKHRNTCVSLYLCLYACILIASFLFNWMCIYMFVLGASCIPKELKQGFVLSTLVLRYVPYDKG